MFHYVKPDKTMSLYALDFKFIYTIDNLTTGNILVGVMYSFLLVVEQS